MVDGAAEDVEGGLVHLLAIGGAGESVHLPGVGVGHRLGVRAGQDVRGAEVVLRRRAVHEAVEAHGFGFVGARLVAAVTQTCGGGDVGAVRGLGFAARFQQRVDAVPTLFAADAGAGAAAAAGTGCVQDLIDQAGAALAAVANGRFRVGVLDGWLGGWGGGGLGPGQRHGVGVARVDGAREVLGGEPWRRRRRRRSVVGVLGRVLDAEEAVPDQEVVAGPEGGVAFAALFGREQGVDRPVSAHVGVAMPGDAGQLGLFREVDLGVLGRHHDAVGVEAALRDLAAASPDRGAACGLRQPGDVVVLGLVRQLDLAPTVPADAVLAAKDQMGAGGRTQDLTQIGPPRFASKIGEVVVLQGVWTDLESGVVRQRVGDLYADRASVHPDIGLVDHQGHGVIADLEGGGSVHAVGGQVSGGADVDVVALHELPEVDLLEQGAALAQGEDALLDRLGDDGLVTQPHQAVAAAQRATRLGQLDLREVVAIAARWRGRGLRGLGLRWAVADHAVHQRQDQMADGFSVDVHDGQHVGPGRVVAGDAVAVLQVRVDDVDEAAVQVLLQPVQRRLLQGEVAEAVQPVAAEGEHHLVAVEMADLAVALPDVRDVEVDGDDGPTVGAGAGVGVGDEAGDELTRFEAVVLAGHLRAAVLDEPEAGATSGEEHLEADLVLEALQLLSQHPASGVAPGALGAGGAPLEVLAVDDHQDVREVGAALVLLGGEVGAEAVLALGLPQQERVFDHVTRGPMTTKPARVVAGRVQQAAVGVA